MGSSPLAGLDIRVSSLMTGAKQAVRFGGGPVIVSPAMMTLMKGADEAELRRLLESIPLLTLPPTWPPDTMFTRPTNVAEPMTMERQFLEGRTDV